MINTTETLDETDLQILNILQTEGRISNLELAKRISLSPTPCSRRLKRLEQSGVIKGYSARINHAMLGLGISALVTVRLSRQTPQDIEKFISSINKRPEITECLLIAGNLDYVLRVNVSDVTALRDFVLNGLKSIPFVNKTSTMLILDSLKTEH